MRIHFRFFLLTTIAIAPLFSVAAEVMPFRVKVDTDNLVTVRAYGKTAIQQRSATEAIATLEGTESSECRPYGRQGSAKASANVRILEETPNGISLEVSASSLSAGGHFRTCAGCVNGNCIGIFPNDTTASARTRASARLMLEFNSDYPASDFRLHVSSSNKGLNPEIRLRDAMKELPLREADRPYVVISGQKGAVFYLDVTLDANTTNKGECCDDDRSGAARVDVRWYRAPILFAARGFEPFIVGGRQTLGFKDVGALTLDGDLQCSGTVVGSRTVLTAAHCIWGFENQKNAMRFLLGPNIVQLSEGPFVITDWEYPNEKRIGGVRYNPNTLEDDIGLVYVDPPFKQTPATLSTDTIPWTEIINKGISLTFVGFGYDKVDGNLEGLGIKREASWQIHTVENRRVLFSVPKRNTCKGDSGGPAFFYDETDPENKKRIQVAITSGGNFPDCTFGIETRIDAYQDWLMGRIR